MSEKIDAIYDATVNKVSDRVFAYCGASNSNGITPLEYQGFSAGSTAGSLKVLESGRYALWFQGKGNEAVQEKLLVNNNVLLYGGNINYVQKYTGNDTSTVSNMGWTVPTEATLVSAGTVTEPWVFDIEANAELSVRCDWSQTFCYISLYVYKIQ